MHRKIGASGLNLIQTYLQYLKNKEKTTMTRKQYAAIKSAQETMNQIQTIVDAVAHAPTTAFSAAKQVAELAAKWNHDFKDCDPSWQVPQAQAQNQGQAPLNIPDARRTAMSSGRPSAFAAV